jgi:hypothetical protein
VAGKNVVNLGTNVVMAKAKNTSMKYTLKLAQG